MAVTVEGVGQKVAAEKKTRCWSHGCVCVCVCGNVLCLLRCVSSQCGQGVQGVKGSRVDRRDLVVVERQEAD